MAAHSLSGVAVTARIRQNFHEGADRTVTPARPGPSSSPARAGATTTSNEPAAAAIRGRLMSHRGSPMNTQKVPDKTAPGMSPAWFVLGIWTLYACMALTANWCIT